MRWVIPSAASSVLSDALEESFYEYITRLALGFLEARKHRSLPYLCGKGGDVGYVVRFGQYSTLGAGVK
jgi:hypothetical protein